MSARRLVFALCFVFGASLILFHKQLISYLTSTRDDRLVLAQISKLEGSAELRDSNQNTSIATENSPVHDQDTLIVSGGLPLRIRFNDGLEVELEASSVAFFENSDRGIFVNLRTGNFRVISKGSSKERTLFVKDGAVLDPLGRTILQPPLKLEPPKPSEDASEPQKNESAISEETLSDSQIANSMSTLRQPLIKCFAANLKNNTKSKGEIYLSFNIERTGVVSSVKILQENFKDDQMLKCVAEVVQRAHFDAFKGDPIVVNYPLYFE